MYRGRRRWAGRGGAERAANLRNRTPWSAGHIAADAADVRVRVAAASCTRYARHVEPNFWHERWLKGQTGFHLGHPNPTLLRHRAALGAAPGSRVLVPMCGKTLDLAWLLAQGHEVVGVELSAVAVQAFFDEQQLSPTIDQEGPLVRYRVSGLEIFCGDLFALDRAHLGPVSALFDRAALVAWPPSMQERYVRHIADLVPSGAHGLLVTFEYEPKGVSGPPFSVEESTVRGLYAPTFEVTHLEREALEVESRFKERGVTSAHECAYALVHR